MTIWNTIKISIILGMIGMASGRTTTQAQDIIDFDVFQKTIPSTQLSRTQQLRYIKYISNQECRYSKEKGDTYLITPSCLFQDKLPKIGFQEALAYLRKHIDSFNTVYNEASQTFTYE